MQALSEPQTAIDAMTNGINQLVRISHTKARKKYFATIGPEISILIPQKDELIEVTGINPSWTGFQALDHGQPLSKAPMFVGQAVSIFILENQNVI